MAGPGAPGDQDAGPDDGMDVDTDAAGAEAASQPFDEPQDAGPRTSAQSFDSSEPPEPRPSSESEPPREPAPPKPQSDEGG
jgi:hypothetical protein